MMDASTQEMLEQALGSQRDASEALGDSDQSRAADSAERAAQELQSAAEEVQKRAREMSEQLQQETKEQAAYRLEKELRQMVGAQQDVVDGIDELAGQSVLRQPGTAEVAEGLASRQGIIRQRIEYVMDESAMLDEGELPGFTWVLKTISSEMARAEAALQRMRIVPEAQSAATAALTKLKLAATALRENSEQQAEQAASELGESPENSSEESESGRKVPPLASLKLLRGLQLDLNERTARIGRGSGDAAWRSRQLGALAVQQKEMALQLESILETDSADSPDDE